MLILEGPDGGGKTTLAEDLAEIFGLEYRKPPPEVLSSRKGPVDPKALIKWWIREIDKCDHHAPYEHNGVYDRTTFISDPIYRLAYGEPSAATTAEMRRGIDYIADHAMVIWCIPPWETTLEALTNENRENLEGLNVQKARIIWWAYMCQMYTWQAFSFQRNLHYDWQNYEYIHGEIKEYLIGN